MIYFVEYEDNCQFVSANDYSKIPEFIGNSTVRDFGTRFELGEPDRKVCNFMYFTPGAFSCDEEGKKLLQNDHDCNQLIPIEIPGQTGAYIVNVMQLLECLDEDRSTITYFKGSGKVKNIDLYVFDYKKIPVHPPTLFKIPQTASSEILCNEAFRQQYKESGLTGLRFVKSDC